MLNIFTLNKNETNNMKIPSSLDMREGTNLKCKCKVLTCEFSCAAPYGSYAVMLR